MQTLYKRGAEAKGFVRSPLAGNEQPDTQGGQAVAADMKAMRAAAERELFRQGRKERDGRMAEPAASLMLKIVKGGA